VNREYLVDDMIALGMVNNICENLRIKICAHLREIAIAP
jgi:hypothetical protein